MAQQPINDDLFESTKMSFGDHLEELRVCLFKAVIGLVIGFLIGLGVAKYVVRWVQTPLRTALEQHYEDRTIHRLETSYGKDTISDDIRSFIRDNGITYDVVYFERGDIERFIEEADTPVGANALQEELNRTLDPPGQLELLKGRLWKPLDPRITTLNAQEAFMIWLKAGFVTGMVLASPFIFLQIWNFVAAGLYPHEKRYVYLFLPISLLLFWSGASMAFFVVFKYVLNFLLAFNAGMDIHSEPRISEWISFVLILPLGFGAAFQLPLVMLFLNRIGIISIEAYIQRWRIAVLVICVVSMLLTPADPISMVMMASPLTALYFLGIGFCRWMPRGRTPFAEAYEP